MNEPENNQSRSVTTTISMIVLGVIVSLYSPLVVSIFEALVFGSHHTEDFFQQLGLYDILGAIYQSTLGWIFKIFRV